MRSGQASQQRPQLQSSSGGGNLSRRQVQLLPLSKSTVIETINESQDEKSVSEVLGDEDLANLLSELTPEDLEIIKQHSVADYFRDEIDSLDVLSDIIDDDKENLVPD